MNPYCKFCHRPAVKMVYLWVTWREEPFIFSVCEWHSHVPIHVQKPIDAYGKEKKKPD